jgi:hypothetical protein
MDIQKDLRKYFGCMEAIKARLAILDALGSGQKPLSHIEFDREIVAIQFRKTLELLAFASMVANRAEYERAYADFASHWNPKDLFSQLELVNADFYPQAFKVGSIDPNGVKHLVPLKGGFLTKPQFITLYDRCGGILHSRNPYSEKQTSWFKEPDIQKWVKHIRTLLRFHRARMYGHSGGWLVTMNFSVVGDTTAHPFEAVPDSPNHSMHSDGAATRPRR